MHLEGNVSSAGMRNLGNVKLEDGDEHAMEMSGMEWLEMIREQAFGLMRRLKMRLYSPFMC